jgi:hypothetical protein
MPIHFPPHSQLPQFFNRDDFFIDMQRTRGGKAGSVEVSRKFT